MCGLKNERGSLLKIYNVPDESTFFSFLSNCHQITSLSHVNTEVSLSVSLFRLRCFAVAADLGTYRGLKHSHTLT